MGLYRFAVNLVHPSVQGPAVNIWHLRTPGEIEEAQADGCMTALHNFYDALTAVTAGGAVARWLGEMTTVEPDPVTVTPGTPWTSTNGTGAPALPGAISMLIKWTTATGGRNGKGRSFISPMAQSACNADGKPSSAALATVSGAATNLVSDSSVDNEWALGIYSREDSLHRDLTGSSVYGKFAVLRSRRD